MREQLKKLIKGKSTYAERVFAEELKTHHIPFRTKVKINDREVDFLIRDRIVVEINGHEQSESRNAELIASGYVPVHISNADILNNRKLIISNLTKLCLLK